MPVYTQSVLMKNKFCCNTFGYLCRGSTVELKVFYTSNNEQ